MGGKRDIKTMVLRFVSVTIFCVLGAAIFYGIEHTGEYNKEKTRKDILYNVTKTNIIRRFGINDTEYELLVDTIMDARSDTPLEWSFPRGLDLCLQTVTTIGYGNKTPITLAGRLFLIPFALVGIPLMLFLLKTVGENLSHLVHFITCKFETKVLARKEVRNSELKCLIAIVAFSVALTFFMAAVSTSADDWSFGQGLYVWIVTFTTVGFGDFIPGANADSTSGIEVVLYRVILMIIGLSLISTIFNTVGDFMEKRNSSAPKLCSGCLSLRCCSKKDSPEPEVHELESKNRYDKTTPSKDETLKEETAREREPVVV